MRIESLAYLVDFAELGSIAAVAQKNFMSEQGISKIFTQLEKESGVILFRKEGRSLKLTAAGEDVVINARKVVDDYHKVQDGRSKGARGAERRARPTGPTRPNSCA